MEIAAAFLAYIAVVAFAIPISLWFAWPASILWGWFIVPAFGAPPLTTLQVYGIFLTLSLMRPKLANKTEIDWSGSFVGILLGPPLTLGIGAAVKYWWM